MKNLYIINQANLSFEFEYPREFIHILDLGIYDLEPWYFLKGNVLTDKYAGLSKRYPDRKLVPFAQRQDNDDTACWDSAVGLSVVIIHDFASKGFETRAEFATFYDWFRQAIEDLIKFDE